jgi:hypothetical protein
MKLQSTPLPAVESHIAPTLRRDTSKEQQERKSKGGSATQSGGYNDLTRQNPAVPGFHHIVHLHAARNISSGGQAAARFRRVARGFCHVAPLARLDGKGRSAMQQRQCSGKMQGSRAQLISPSRLSACLSLVVVVHHRRRLAGHSALKLLELALACQELLALLLDLALHLDLNLA